MYRFIRLHDDFGFAKLDVFGIRGGFRCQRHLVDARRQPRALANSLRIQDHGPATDQEDYALRIELVVSFDRYRNRTRKFVLALKLVQPVKGDDVDLQAVRPHPCLVFD